MKRISLKEQKELVESMDNKLLVLKHTLSEIEAGKGDEINAYGITNFESAKNIVSTIEHLNKLYLK